MRFALSHPLPRAVVPWRNRVLTVVVLALIALSSFVQQAIGQIGKVSSTAHNNARGMFARATSPSATISFGTEKYCRSCGCITQLSETRTRILREWSIMPFSFFIGRTRAVRHCSLLNFKRHSLLREVLSIQRVSSSLSQMPLGMEGRANLAMG
jgi:hypothetical protein